MNRKGAKIRKGRQVGKEVEFVSDVDWRPLTDYERRVLSRLLSAGFPGSGALAAQVDVCRARTVDDCGCLEFAVPESAPPAEVVARIPAELHGALDREGVPLEILLFVADGCLEALEFVRYGGDLNLYPDPEELEVLYSESDGSLRSATE